MMRARANASATRDVSMVIQRQPHCSATYAVVPEPQVGSKTREVTVPASLFPAGKQRRVRFFLRNAFACSDLTVGLLNIPKQLQFLNEPVIFGRVQHHGGAPSMLRQHQ